MHSIGNLCIGSGTFPSEYRQAADAIAKTYIGGNNLCFTSMEKSLLLDKLPVSAFYTDTCKKAPVGVCVCVCVWGGGGGGGG